MKRRRQAKTKRVDEDLMALAEIDVPVSGRYTLAAKVLALRLVCELVKGDKGHRPLSLEAALTRAYNTLHIPKRTIESQHQGMAP
jgi:hypothetical protein